MEIDRCVNRHGCLLSPSDLENSEFPDARTGGGDTSLQGALCRAVRVGDQISGLTSGHLFHPISLDDIGAFAGEVFVPAATNGVGSYTPFGSCADWTSTPDMVSKYTLGRFANAAPSGAGSRGGRS